MLTSSKKVITTVKEVRRTFQNGESTSWDIISRKMINTEEKIVRFCKDGARVIGFMFSLIALIWIVHVGYKLTTGTRDIETGGSEGSYIALVFGVITVVLGLIYFIVGLNIVAELVMDMLAWLHKEDGVTTHKQEKEQKTICQIFIQVSATMVSMFMLMWAIYYGYKLAAEAQSIVVYNRLAFLIGIITMAFGFVYFIIGIGLLADYALNLTSRLQEDGTESELFLNREEGASLLV